MPIYYREDSSNSWALFEDVHTSEMAQCSEAVYIYLYIKCLCHTKSRLINNSVGFFIVGLFCLTSIMLKLT